MIEELNEEKRKYLNNDIHIGTVVMNWFDISLSYRWYPKDILIELAKNKYLCLNDLQEELNEIFALIRNFKNVITLCKSEENELKKEFYVQKKVGCFVLTLTPSNSKVSYIDVYMKQFIRKR